jgi:hypothetical protein
MKRNASSAVIGLRSLLVAVLIFWGAMLPDRGSTEPAPYANDAPAQTFVVTNTDDSGAGSLRDAITSANSNPGPDTITFNIPGSGIQFIFVTAPMNVTDPVFINGYSQPGYAGTPLIHLEGMGTGTALNITGGVSVVAALSFTSFFAGATNGMVRISGTGNNVVTGCSFGVRGDSTRPTTASIGVLIDGSNGNRVGGTAASERNYFAIGAEHGLVIQNGAANTLVVGNWFGTGPNGARMASTGRDNIRILNSPNNTIGGSTGTTPGGACTGECNVIAGAGNNGVFINGATATGNRVIGNFVGLFAAGTSVNANNLGVRIDNAPGNTVGGTTAAERNVITGNSGLAGVMVTGASSTGNVITGNYVGLFTGGTSAPSSGNSLDGILVNASSTGTRIGGSTAGERNVISGLAGNGIEIAGSNGNTILGNYIGTDATGMVRSTTVGNGILIAFSDNNTIGGTTGTSPGGACTGACNLISGNGNNGAGDGITLNTANGNTLKGNYVGVTVDGMTAMVNGRTPDGSIYNGDAVGLYNADNNVIGTPPAALLVESNANMQAPDTLAPPVFCLQGAPDTNYMIVDLGLKKVIRAEDCETGTTIENRDLDLETGAGLETGFSTRYVDFPYIGGYVNTGTGTGYGFVRSLRSFDVYDRNPTNNNCVCPVPAVGPEIHAGETEIGDAENNSDGNTVGPIFAGLGPTGVRVSIDSPITIFGSGNALFNPHVVSGSLPGVSIGVGANNSLSGVTYQTTGNASALALAPGTNGNLPRPSVTLRIDPDGRRFAIVTITGAPAETILRIQVEEYVSEPGWSSTLPLGQAVEAETTVSGTLTAEIEVPKSDFEGFSKVTANVTVINQAPRETLVGGSLGSSSEFAAPVAVPKRLSDLDGDGKTEIAVYRNGATSSDASYWYILSSINNAFREVQFGSGGDQIVSGDFTSDRKIEFAVWRSSNGTWYFSRSAANPSTNFETFPFGGSGDVPLAGDFDGDKRGDLAIYRTGTWWIRYSLLGSTVVQSFGLSADRPIPADYNGDGRTDVAIYRSGQWWISVCPSCAARVEQWGTAGDVPVPGDFDGDGKADIAVWRPSDGIWYISKSSGGFVGYQWGLSGDIPLNGDFDGDGMNDIAVWRPSNGTWYIIRSTGGFLGYQWGQNGDIPVPQFPGQQN